MKTNKVTVIGGGLAGSEACFRLLKQGYEVHLYERRPLIDDHAHETDLFGELVCSNSLKSNQLDNACGLLKQEMRELGSITMEAAKYSQVPAGNALSVDRTLFAEQITAKLLSFPNLTVHREEVSSLGEGPIILATGPLTSLGLLEHLSGLLGKGSFSFFDASAPIVKKDSIDFSKAYYKSRYSQEDEAYINCPFNKEEYTRFVTELLAAEKAPLHSFDTQYFEGCLPVEVIASRGFETLRHGPLKPFGLEKPDGSRPYAVLQLRQDTKLGDAYNLVGFQTNLTYPEQKRVFSLIPGLEHASFIRYGLMHRNHYLDSPRVLNPNLSLKARDDVFVAGQLSGVEGYVESAAFGILSAIMVDRYLKGLPPILPPRQTILGALLSYVTETGSTKFSPMNANWALIPGASKDKREIFVDDALKGIQSYRERIDGCDDR